VFGEHRALESLDVEPWEGEEVPSCSGNPVPGVKKGELSRGCSVKTPLLFWAGLMGTAGQAQSSGLAPVWSIAPGCSQCSRSDNPVTCPVPQCNAGLEQRKTFGVASLSAGQFIVHSLN
jgi:hypothetical protein